MSLSRKRSMTMKSMPSPRLADLVVRPRPGLVLRQAVGDLVPRGLRADPEVTLGSVARRLLEPAERNADLVRIVVVGADDIRAADPTEMLHDELRRVVPRQEVFTRDPGELRRVDRRAGAERGSVPAPTLRAVAVEDRAELAPDLVGDAFAQTTT